MQSYTTTLTETVIRTGAFLKRLSLDYRKGIFLSFVFAFSLRLIPEVLSYPYPIGYDTVYCAARMKSDVVWSHWTSVFSMWLLYAILIPLYQVVQVDPFLLLKLAAPALYALNVCGVYYFSKKALGWTGWKCLIAAFFFAFQLASLRLSWDLHRNVLGMGILLFALPWIQNLETKRGFALFALLSTLVVFAHDLVSIVLFAAVFGVILGDFLLRKEERALRVFVAASPALVLFLARYLGVFPVQVYAETNVISAVPPIQRPANLFFLANYIGSSSSVIYPTYLDLASHVLSLFTVLYLLCLPLVFVGFFRHRLLNSFTLLFLVGAFSSLVIPFCALEFWYRWMILLVYPFTFYAVNGIEKVLRSKGESVRPNFKWMRWMKVSKRTVYGILFLTVFLGFLLMTVRFSDHGVFAIPTTGMYLPSTMLQNTISLQDVGDTVEAIEWLNRMDDASVVLVHNSFLWWTSFYLDKKNVIVDFRMNLEAALDVALGHGFDSVYLVWGNETMRWYNLSVPKDFVAVFSSGRVSVFQYFQQD